MAGPKKTADISQKGEAAVLQQIAWRALKQVQEVRPKKVAALRRSIQQGTYRIDPGKFSSALLDLGDRDLAALMSLHPVLIPEHVALYGRKAIRDLLLILEARDHFSGQHCDRAAAIALRFARYLSLAPADLEALKTAGQLHDLGKIEIRKTILLKKKPLTAVDRAIIESHPGTGVKIVQPFCLEPKEQEIILYHHEHWDGRGYPNGLAGEQIPFLCRLMALADVFEALTSDRPRRPRFPVQQALEMIRDQAGSHFDPYLAKHFLKMLSKAKSD
jgi:putative nucleotidyltransferase with HDIG domain